MGGLAFRLAGLGYVRLGYDDSYQMYLALRLLDGHEWLLLGQPSSIFLDNPPLMAYLQALPLLVWRSPWAVYLFVALLNGAATWFVYGAAAPLLGRRAGLAAAFLFAASPWIVLFSQRPWAQGLLPLLMAVLAWGLLPTLITAEPRPIPFAIGLLALTAMTQTYVLAFALVLPVGLLLLVHRRRVPTRPLRLGASVFLLGLALYGAALVAAPGENPAKLESFAAEGHLTFNPEAIEHAVRLVTGLEYEARGAPIPGPAAVGALTRAGQNLLALALLVGISRAALALRDGGRDRRLALSLLVWFLAPTLGLALLPYPAHPHYLLLTLPAGQLLAAWGLRPVLDRPGLLRPLAVALVFLAGLFVFADARARQAVAEAPGGPQLEERPIIDVTRVGAVLRELASGTVYPRRVVAEDHSAVLSAASATYLERLDGLDYPALALLPGREPILYLLAGDRAADRLRPGWLNPVASRLLTLRDGSRMALHRVAPVSRSEALAMPATAVDRPTSAGLTLLGYDAGPAVPHAPGEDLTLTTYWRVDDLRPERAGWFVAAYYQILNAAAQIEANVNGRGQWGYRWQLGDVYVERAVVPLPAGLSGGDYRLIFGLFDPIHALDFPMVAAGGDAPFHSIPLAVAR